MVVLVAVSFIATTPSSAMGFTYFYGEKHGWGSNEVNYCFEDGFYGWDADKRALAADSIEHINQNGTFSGFHVKKVGRNSAWPNDCHIHFWLEDFSEKGWPSNPGRTTFSWNFLGFINRADVYINSDKGPEFYWGYDNQLNGYGNVCKVGVSPENWPGCVKDIDFMTIILHETGHAVGLGHSTNGTYCVAGERFNQVRDACTNDFYSADPMYGNAGDGYRRAYPTSDMMQGLEDLY